MFFTQTVIAIIIVPNVKMSSIEMNKLLDVKI